jgi:RNA polymerase sigma factor (sigma-70 family)
MKEDQLELTELIKLNNTHWTTLVKTKSGLMRATVRKTVYLNGGFLSDSNLEDIVQDIFCRLLYGDCALLRRFDVNLSSFDNWLKIISKTCAQNAMRKQRKDSDLLSEIIRQHGRTKSRAISGNNGVSNIFDIIESSKILTKRQKYVLVSLFREGLSIGEISSQIGIKCQTIRNEKNKALKKLRKLDNFLS